MSPFKILPTVVLSSVPAWFALAGEPTPPTPPASVTPPAHSQDMENRVKELEARVRELEGLLRDRGINPQAPNRPNQSNGQRFGLRGRDPQDVFEQMRREMERHFGNMDDFGGIDDFDTGIPRSMVQQRPRLGVEMRAADEEMNERYKNNVKEGVFIVSVVQNSPAENAGLRVGDAVTSFDGKQIKQPADLLEAVKTAQPGKKALTVVRRGESVALTVELGETVAEAPEERADRGGWLRRGDMDTKAPVNQNKTSRTEVRASALETSDALSTELKLNDEQKKKMADVLAKHRTALNDEVATKNTKMNRRGNVMSLSGDLSQLVEKHAQAAETELSGTLSPEQIRQWGAWRKRNNSVSVNQTMHFESSTAPGVRAPAPDDIGF